MAATASDQRAVRQELLTVLQSLGATHKAIGPAMIDVPSRGSFLVEAIITYLEKCAGVQNNTPIRFSEPELDNKYTVADIKRHYTTLYSTWHSWHSDPEEFVDTMLSGWLPNGLDWYAKKLLSGDTPPKVVVLGHTHHAESVGGYYNDGCWCIPGSLDHGDSTPHYVEIVEENATLIPWKQLGY
jgi:hypothetical protein